MSAWGKGECLVSFDQAVDHVSCDVNVPQFSIHKLIKAHI
jgi:hypothetical protein